jgi:hypothetical protein
MVTVPARFGEPPGERVKVQGTKAGKNRQHRPGAITCHMPGRYPYGQKSVRAAIRMETWRERDPREWTMTRAERFCRQISDPDGWLRLIDAIRQTEDLSDKEFKKAANSDQGDNDTLREACRLVNKAKSLAHQHATKFSRV